MRRSGGHSAPARDDARRGHVDGLERRPARPLPRARDAAEQPRARGSRAYASRREHRGDRCAALDLARHRVHRRLDAILDAQLVEYLADVVFHGRGADVKLGADLAVALALGDELEDAQLAFAEFRRDPLDALGAFGGALRGRHERARDPRSGEELTARDGANAANDLVDRRVLDDVAGRTGADRVEDRRVVGGDGEYQHTRVGPRGEQTPSCLDAGDARHLEVHEDDVRLTQRVELDPARSVGSLADDLDVGLLGQKAAEARPEEVVVVDEEDSYRALGLLFGRLGGRKAARHRVGSDPPPGFGRDLADAFRGTFSAATTCSSIARSPAVLASSSSSRPSSERLRRESRSRSATSACTSSEASSRAAFLRSASTRHISARTSVSELSSSPSEKERAPRRSYVEGSPCLALGSDRPMKKMFASPKTPDNDRRASLRSMVERARALAAMLRRRVLASTRPLASPPAYLRRRQMHRNDGAVPGLRHDLGLAAATRCPLAHRLQAEAPGTARLEAHPVVLHLEQQPVVGYESYLDGVRLAVPDRVGDGLSNDPEHCLLGFG